MVLSADVKLPDETDNITEQTEIGSQDGYQEVSLRKIVNNPGKWEREKVIVKGKSNSFKDFLKADGYQIDMECSKYPEFDYSHHEGIKIYAVVEYIPNELPLQLRCSKPPELQN